MTIKNKVQLITYVDRLSAGTIADLQSLMDNQFSELFGGVHLLPFFDKIDGEDAGFDPINHCNVDSRLGDWSDIKSLSDEYDVMADLIINHVSSDSHQFQDYLQKGDESPYSGMFLRYKDVFPTGATEQDLLNLYRPRPGLPFNRMRVANGNEELLWTTFTSKQIDINIFHEEGEKYIESILSRFAENGIKMIRLDAAGYAVKTAGTSCFMTDDTYDYISHFSKKANSMGMEVLVEIHSHYQQQIEIAKHVDRVYDFALPPLVLHALYSCNSAPLKKWLAISPRNTVSVLDTHDGIGIVDVAPSGDLDGLLNKTEIDALVEEIHIRTKGESLKSTGKAANNLDLYQVNATFYSALGEDDNDYLLSRLIQFICPGVPQVYYAGLLAGKNDMDLLAQSHVGRDINRHYYTADEIEVESSRDVVSHLFALMRLRNTHPAFEGEFTLLDSADISLEVIWKSEYAQLSVQVLLLSKSFVIISEEDGIETVLTNWGDIDAYVSSPEVAN